MASTLDPCLFCTLPEERVLMANDLAMLYVMTMKPDLAGSLLAVAGTILAIGAVRVITRGLHGFIVSRHSVALSAAASLPDAAAGTDASASFTGVR